MSITAYPTLRLKLTPPTALKLQFLPAVPGFGAAATEALISNKVNRPGDTMTGFLSANADPELPLHYATKQYVDTHGGGGGGGGGAPTTAQYITAAADATLTNERVLTNTATVSWDFSTPGQAKATAVTSGSGTETQRHVKQYGAIGDGVSDDTASIQNAINATPYGGRLRIPEGNYLVSGSGAAIFTRTTPINIWGDGSGSAQITVASTVPNTRDVFRFAPTAAGSGWSVTDLAIVGQGGGSFGRHAIHLDTQASGAFAYNCDFRDLLILKTATGHSIHVTNTQLSGGFAYSEIASSNLESIFLAQVGDGIEIRANIITSTGTNTCVFASQILGAGNLQIDGNVLAGVFGHIIIDSGVMPIIRDNELETPAGQTNTYGYMIELRGTTGNILAPLLLNNQVQALTGTGNPVPIRILNASNTKVTGGRLSVQANNHIVIGASATDTVIDGSGQWVFNDIIGGPAVFDTGVRTVWETRGSGVPVAGQIARWTSASQIEGVAGSTLFRERLTANKNYFVRTDGNDANTGLVNNAGGALLTLQEAWNRVAALDVSGFTVTVQIGDGTYTGGVTITSWFSGGGRVVFQGNAGTPANVIHSTTSAVCWDIQTAGAGVLAFKNFKTQSTTLGDHFTITAPLSMEYSGMNFGTAAGGANGCHIRAFHPGFKIACLGSYTISGGAFAHLLLWYGVYESGLTTTVITLTGSPTWGIGYLYIDNNAKVSHVGPTFSGAATGARYNIGVLCSVRVNISGDYFPGSIAGGTILAGGGSVYL